MKYFSFVKLNFCYATQSFCTVELLKVDFYKVYFCDFKCMHELVESNLKNKRTIFRGI